MSQDLGSDILEPALARLSSEIRVATIGRVATYARDTGRAVVSRLIRYVNSAGQEKQWPDAQGVVVVQPRGDGYGLAFDIATQDPGVMLASDGGWGQSWEAGQPSRPKTRDSHTYGSAALFPGGRLATQAPANPIGAMRCGAEDGSACVDLRRTRGPLLGSVVVSAAGPAASVKLGSDAAATPVALGPLVKTMDIAAWTAFGAAIAAGTSFSVIQKGEIAAAVTAAIAAITATPNASVKVVSDL